MRLALPLSISDLPNLIPHSGEMCLWQEVIAFDNEKIHCATNSHLSPTNPLKVNGELSPVNLIEYGAQAIAIHGGLLALTQAGDQASQPTMGYIASLKKIRFFEFNASTSKLFVDAMQLSADEAAKLYTFEVSDAENRKVCEGNVLVMHPQ